jgi:hypothetical protein
MQHCLLKFAVFFGCRADGRHLHAGLAVKEGDKAENPCMPCHGAAHLNLSLFLHALRICLLDLTTSKHFVGFPSWRSRDHAPQRRSSGSTAQTACRVRQC